MSSRRERRPTAAAEALRGSGGALGVGLALAPIVGAGYSGFGGTFAAWTGALVSGGKGLICGIASTVGVAGATVGGGVTDGFAVLVAVGFFGGGPGLRS